METRILSKILSNIKEFAEDHNCTIDEKVLSIVFSKEDEEKLKERLRVLGYLD